MAKKKKSVKSKYIKLNALYLSVFLVLFAVFLIFKISNPTLIVGGKSPKKEYKVAINEVIKTNKSSYQYIFDNGNRCDDNFPLGIAILNYDISGISALFCYTKYATHYNTTTKTPVWTSHVLKKTDFKNAKYVKRSNDFREDDIIKGQSVSSKPKDYVRTGYDKGHLSPAADFSYDEKAMSESFYMTNIAPQAPMQNRKIWGELEKSVRALLKKTKDIDELYVTTGVLYYKNGDLGSINNDIKIPTHFYKIIIEPKTGASAAYLIPNNDSVGSDNFHNYLIKIADLEKVTKINFHSQLKKDVANAIENTNSGSLDMHLN